VSGIQRIGYLDSQLEQILHFQRATRDAMFQGQAIQKLHHDLGLIAMLADLMDRANVGMVQRRGGTGFAAEAFEHLAVMC